MTSNRKILSMMKSAEPMSKHTTFRIGGPADIWAQPEDEGSLAEILALCRQDGIRVVVVGNGSNLLVKDSGIRSCVINLNTSSFKNIKVDDNLVSVGAGLGLQKLLSALCEKGLSGLEPLAGIPATVGGALAMNAGGKACIGDLVEDITAIDDKGRVVDLTKSGPIFRYRGWNLEKYIILRATLRFEKSNAVRIRDTIRQHLSEKIEKQELDKPSAGCVFKNPEGDSAGRLIDASGLKGRKVGGAAVSTKHANFIINAGNAACSDVLKLIDLIRDKVKKDHGIALETEIRVIG